MREMETALGKAMAKLAVAENARARQTWGSHRSLQGTETARENGAKGGRPEKIPKPLSVKAGVVNRLLLTGLNCAEVAEIIDKSPEAVRDIRTRYQLPRKAG